MLHYGANIQHLQQRWKYSVGKNEVGCQLQLHIMMKEICVTVNISMDMTKWIG
jgi:hypothetical protein